eukprot:7667326-Pyramimonas_sp.AAC.1
MSIAPLQLAASVCTASTARPLSVLKNKALSQKGQVAVAPLGASLRLKSAGARRALKYKATASAERQMNIADNVTQLIGQTPMVYLNK